MIHPADPPPPTPEPLETPLAPIPIVEDVRGATSAEYAFLLLLVVAAVALGLSAVGASTSAVLTTASTSI